VDGAGACTARETSDIGSADDSSLDPVDCVRGLAHMDVLRERVRAASLARRRRGVLRPRNASEAHEAETGHPLVFGCCKLDVRTEAA